MSVKPLRAPAGASKKKTIVGRGRSSGSGKTSGKGHKGQKARSGGGVRPGFEGGQMPIYRRVAARGFSNHPFKVEFVVINVSSLEKVYADGETVSHETLVQKGLVKNSEVRVKILGEGELKKKLEVAVPAVSASAKEKIEKAGGKVISAGTTSDTTE
ncbi:MAG: 50S ribosomal protein L15 [Spirochaetales bacterium]|nr:50S ribosomal protein L15 [Spirochaetales bacterium]